MEIDDDKVHHTHQVDAVMDLKRRVRREIKDYTPRYLLKEQKIHFDVLDYWRKNKDIYPCLFKAAEACLHVPATSIPAERIFTLRTCIMHLIGIMGYLVSLSVARCHLYSKMFSWVKLKKKIVTGLTP